MRNLRNTRHDRFKVSGGRNVTAAAWDATDDSLVFTTGPSETDHAIVLKRLPSHAQDIDQAVTIASWDAPTPNPELPCDRVLDLRCFPDSQTIALVLAGGDIVVVREDPQPGEDAISIVGSVDAGLKAAAWSPDEELLALLASGPPNHTLLLMTRAFDPLLDPLALVPADLDVSDHVSVGWGRRETQFKGRGAAKALRDPTLPQHVESGVLSACDDGSSTISWRGDGECFAVNAIIPGEPARRVVRVYSREGVLESVSEPVDGLEGALAWKPSGQLLAGVRRREDGLDVVFFERNGLRHGEFALRLDAEQMNSVGRSVALKWNTDSTVLAVTMQDRAQLWTMGNYHYYLKQEILFAADYSIAAGFGLAAELVWHPEKALHLGALRGPELRRLHYSLEICRGSVEPPDDLGLVAVIDGRTLKITPLRVANVPPPMAFEDIQLPDNALDVAISGSGREIAVLHAGGIITLWHCDYAVKPPAKATLNARLKGSDLLNVSAAGHAQALSIRTDHDRIYYASSTDEVPVVSGGVEARVDSTDATNVTWTSSSQSQIVLRMSENGLLIIESDTQTLRVSGCTSFLVTSSHLIYTTTQHLLKFVHLHDGPLDIPADEPEKDERCRSIERGAKIVTVMPSTYSMVLQMPRGNLETIYPRALVLAAIRQNLRSREYKKAFAICRAHRVDMNILHDYSPDHFMQDVDLLVKQLKKTEYVDLLISSFSEEDVSQTIYRETLSPSERQVLEKESTHPPRAPSKVNRVCDAFLHALEKDRTARLQNIVTAHVCKTPPDLEAGLKLVSELRRQADQARLEQAVDHICFLADVNQLYETALGLYDLDVALLVAQQSQKDPREYLPYLQGLSDMPELRKRFSIDNDLKRHSKALAQLHALGVFEELLSYMEKHELYSTAVELYRYDAAQLEQIMRRYADYLSSRNRFEEAGVAYEYISDHTAAYEAFRAVGLWRECLSNAAAASISPAELTTLAQDLANSAEEAKEFGDAAIIHLDHLQDLESAVRLWCRASQFAEAIRQAIMRQRPDLLRTAIDPALVEASATTTELLAEMKAQLAAQVPRLRELRQKKAEDPMAFLEGGGSGGPDIDIADDLSLAPTNATTSAGTFLTRYTGRGADDDGTLASGVSRRTSKNRRREERKRARGKKGSVYEEEYLVNSVGRLVERFNDAVAVDGARLVRALARRAMRERAVAVQAAFDEVGAACAACLPEVFPPHERQQQLEGMRFGQEIDGEAGLRPVGGQGVLFDALVAPRREAPVLKAFERLSILG